MQVIIGTFISLCVPKISDTLFLTMSHFTYEENKYFRTVK